MGALAVSACALETPAYLPIPSGSAAMILAVSRPEATTLTGFDLVGTTVEPNVSSVGPIRLTALFYASSLEENHLRAGPISVAERIDFSAALPRAASGFELQLDEGSAGDWVSLGSDALAGPLPQIRIQPAPECIDLVADVPIALTPWPVAGLIRSDEDGAIAILATSTPGEQAVRITSASVEPLPLAFPDAIPIAVTTGSGRTDYVSARSVLASEDLIFAGEGEGSYALLASRPREPLGDDLFWIAATGGSTAAAHVFGLDARSRLIEMWSAGSRLWSPPHEPAFGRGGIAVGSGGDVLATVLDEAGRDGLLHLDGGQLSLEGTPTPRHLTSLWNDASGVIFLGDDHGGVFRRFGDGWQPLDGSPISRLVRAFASLPNGVLIAGENGEVVELLDDGTFCPPVMTRFGFGALLPLADSILGLETRFQDGPPSRLIRLRPRASLAR